MTVEVSHNYNAMNAQEVTTNAPCFPKGGAELEYPHDRVNQDAGMRCCPRGGAELEYPNDRVNEEQLPLIKAKANSWNEDEDTTEPGDDSCGEEPPSGFVPVTSPAHVMPGTCAEQTPHESEASSQAEELRPFSLEETFFIFDWDDTILPSCWVQSQGLRLDEESQVSDFQREQLSQVANLAMETLRAAKEHGTVVLVTNAERGWIELSCQKFMPTLYPILENVKILSARTTYESREVSSPLDWKVHAFKSEILRVFGEEAMSEPARRKNVLSLGDSMHEREALLRATASLPNCRSKSLKFVERPDIGQICKQHSLITGCFDRIIHHDGNLDLCIRCA